MRLAYVPVLVWPLVLLGCGNLKEDMPAQDPLGHPVSVTNPGPVSFPPTVTPTPTPAPTPKPQPTPAPTAAPPPQNTGGSVAKVHVGIVFVVCGGTGVPNSVDATRVQVGCKAHMDINFKDANRRPTDCSHDANWTFDFNGNPNLAEVREDPWQPVIIGQEPGLVTVRAVCDGVVSNNYQFRFY